MSKGNVVVAVRVRPLNEAERGQAGRCVLSVQGETVKLRGFDRSFTFDHCFSAEEGGDGPSQAEVYSVIGGPLTAHALQGFNTCILAYGQTGAGKTHTMLGVHDEHLTAEQAEEGKGIIPRLCNDLFCQLDDLRSQTREQISSIKCEVSFFEIYNERVNCLLSDDVKAKLKVREHPVTGPYVEGLSTKEVSTFEDVSKLIEKGSSSRTVAETRHNLRSSRSHAVFTIIITQTIIDVDTGDCRDRVSRVNLVDLAGSERLGTGPVPHQSSAEVVKDGININKSLSTLGRVIHALSEKPGDGSRSRSSLPGAAESDRGGAGGEKAAGGWIAYRDSVLTWLLKENLGGNSKTVMLACLSPSHTQFEETLNTLRYADRVKRIKNNAVVNEDQNAKLVRELYKEIRYLRSKLEDGSGGELARAHSSMSNQSGLAIAGRRPGLRRASCNDATSPQRGWKPEDWKHDLNSSEDIIEELNLHWERKMEQTRLVYQDQLAKVRGGDAARDGRRHSFDPAVELSLDDEQAPGCAVDETPLLVSLDPHLVPGEFVSWSILEGDTIVTSAADRNTPDGARLIKLTDGVNLCDPHCLVVREGRSVRLSPGSGSITFVDGQLLTDTVELSHATRVIFGSSHAFYYLDPVEAKVLRDKRKGTERVPKVLDWAYASNEFAQVMDCCKSYEDVIKLQDEVEYWRSLTSEGTSDAKACAACCLVLMSEPKYATSYAKTGLIFPLNEGRNRVSAEEWGLTELGDVFYVDVIRGQLYRRESEDGPPQPLWHGMKLTVGHSIVMVNCPCSPIDGDMVQPDTTARKYTNSPRKKSVVPKPKQLVFRDDETDQLINSVMSLQYQMLAMHDVLYCLPAELGELSTEDLIDTQPPEIVELMRFKRELKDFRLLEAPSKQLAPPAFKKAFDKLTMALRVLTHHFTHRLDHPPPNPLDDASECEHAEVTSTSAASNGHDRPFRDSRSPGHSTRSVSRDKQAEEQIGALEHAIRDMESASKQIETEFREKLKDTECELDIWQHKAQRAEREVTRLNVDLSTAYEKLQELELGAVSKQSLEDEIKQAQAKLLRSDASWRHAEAELKAARAELDEARCSLDAAQVEAAGLQRKATQAETIADDASRKLTLLQSTSTDRLQAEAARAEANSRKLAPPAAPPDEPASELQDVVAALTDIGKKDKKQIKKLQQQISEMSLTIKTLKRPPSPREEPPAPVDEVVPKPPAQQQLEDIIQHIKACLLPLGLTVLPVIEKISADIQSRGVLVPLRAWQFLSKVLSQHQSNGDVVQLFDKTSAVRALREIAVYHDMSPPAEPVALVYNEVLAHGAGVNRLASDLKSEKTTAPAPHSRSQTAGAIRPPSPKVDALYREIPNFSRALSACAKDPSLSRESPVKRRSPSATARTGRFPSPQPDGHVRKERSSSSANRMRRPSPSRPCSRPPVDLHNTVVVAGSRRQVASGGGRSLSRGKSAGQLDYLGGATVPPTTASLREPFPHQATKSRSDSATRRVRTDSPRTQLAARLLQRVN